VVIVTDPRDYETVLSELKADGVTPATSARLATKAFQRTSEYDRAISSWLGDHPPT